MKRNSKSFSNEYSTWIIAYCPDGDSFFCTNQRCFFWEYDKEFPSEHDAVEYFRNHVEEFKEVRRKIAEECGGIRKNGDVFLENTKEKWKCE